MSNWADTRERRYNEYVGMPTETYGAVGLFKQGMYEQGIQQIQTALSTVAGLEIARDVDKNYLNSKVSEVTSKINNIGGGDWSNKNLVSKATGIATTVAKDQYVQDAVYSTAALKQFAASQKEIKEKHPELYPVSAEWYDSQELQRYMSSNELGDKYKGPKEATRHFGVKRDEEVRKALKDLEPSITTQIGANGKYEYIYDKTSMITPEQITAVVDGVIASNPEYQKSLSIDGLYSYKDATPIELLKGVNDIATKDFAYYDASIDELKNFKTKNPQLDITSDEYQENYGPDGKLARLEKAKKGQIEYYDKLRKDILAQDPNTVSSVKQSLFRGALVNGYVANFKMQQSEREIKENINAVKTEDFALKYINAGLDPDTKQPPLPGSKYYGFKSGKKSDGSSNDGTASTIQLSGAANPTDTYSELEAEFKNWTKKIEDLDQAFKIQYSQKYDKDLAQADAYIQEQEKRYQNGESVDLDYLAYKKEKEIANVSATAIGNLKVQAEIEAEKQKPIKQLGIKQFDGLSFAVDYGPNGKILHNLNEFDKLVESFVKRSETSVDFKNISENDPDYLAYKKLYIAGGNKELQKNFAAKYLIDRQKGKLNAQSFNALKEIIDKGYTKYSNKILDPVRDQYSAQQDVKNKYIAERIGTLSPKGKNLAKGTDEQKEATAALLNSVQKGENPEVTVPEDAQAISVYRDPVTNQAKIDYTYGKNGTTKATQIVPDGSVLNFLPSVSKYDYLRTAIDTDPSGKTAPLSTSNGKITYRIGKNNIGGDYYVQIKFGEDWMPATPLNRQDIGSLYETIEAYAKIPELAKLPPKEAATLLLSRINNPQ